MLTAGYWRAKLGGVRAAIGRMLTVDGQPREIIGVLPDSFHFLDRDVSLVVPYRFDRSKVSSDSSATRLWRASSRAYRSLMPVPMSNV